MMRVKMRVREGFLEVSRGFGPRRASTTRRTDFFLLLPREMQRKNLRSPVYEVTGSQVAGEGLLYGTL